MAKCQCLRALRAAATWAVAAAKAVPASVICRESVATERALSVRAEDYVPDTIHHTDDIHVHIGFFHLKSDPHGCRSSPKASQTIPMAPQGPQELG